MVQVTRAMPWRLPDRCIEPHKQLSLEEPCHDQPAGRAARSLRRGLGNSVYILVQNTTNSKGFVNQDAAGNVQIYTQNLLYYFNGHYLRRPIAIRD